MTITDSRGKIIYNNQLYDAPRKLEFGETLYEGTADLSELTMDETGNANIHAQITVVGKDGRS